MVSHEVELCSCLSTAFSARVSPMMAPDTDTRTDKQRNVVIAIIEEEQLKSKALENKNLVAHAVTFSMCKDTAHFSSVPVEHSRTLPIWQLVETSIHWRELFNSAQPKCRMCLLHSLTIPRFTMTTYMILKPLPYPHHSLLFPVEIPFHCAPPPFLDSAL